MPNDPAISATQPPAGPDAHAPQHGIVQRADGVWLDASVPGPALVGSVENIFLADSYFSGLDYAVLLRALHGQGEPPAGSAQGGWLRFATGIVGFEPARRALYRSVKIDDGVAEYYFEPVFVPDPDDPNGVGLPTRLDADEFVADMWRKGIRFGIDVDTVRAAIASGQAGRIVVARRLDPVPGQDARVIEVSEELHRNDAPRLLANGKLDLNSFQNRFPQIQQGVRLLKKLPRVAGTPGMQLSGITIDAELPADLDLQAYCGPGTTVERTGEGEFLVSQQAGFLSLDSRSSQVSVGDKIVSHDGVSARTTGNLQLAGDYEEFGEVQEKRVVEGDSITLHADVFGKVVSRGGTILLNRNLVGGTALNKCGDIVVSGVASGALIQSNSGEVVLQRAENCVVSATRVRIEHAINCEIVGHEVRLGVAEGCAVAGRNLLIESAAPRRQSDMVAIVQVPDCARLDQVIGATRQRVEQLAEVAAQHKAGLDQLAADPGVRKYMRLATGVRKNEITLTPEQVPAFQRMAQAVGPALKEIGKLSALVKSIEAERAQGLELATRLDTQREQAGNSRVELMSVQGDIQVRVLLYTPDGSSTYDLQPREIKALLRGNVAATLLFSGSDGAFEWDSDCPGHDAG